MTVSLRPSFPRLALIGLLLTLAAFVLPARAATTADAEHFVQVNVDKGLTILSNKAVSQQERRSEFRGFLLKLADVNRTALFTLGAARRTARPADIEAFTNAFKDYAIAVYESRLSAFSGQTLKVKDSTERAPGDFIVETVLSDPNASNNQQPIQVAFRLVPANGGFKVIDVSVVGVWLAIEERDQFTSFLQQHNDSVPALTAHLETLARQLETNPQGGPGSTKQGG